MHVFAIPTRTRFRGIARREGVLIEGPAGWGEFSPFTEYGPREAARWLACAREAAETGWPAPVRDRVPVNVTVPALPPDRAAALAAAGGCRTAKIKVAESGQTFHDDRERVAAVRDALGSEAAIRVDANGGWSVDEAADHIAALARYGLEYAEQPCATLPELAELRLRLARRGIDVPIAADESIRRAEDPLKARAAGAADIAVLKVQPLGGVRAALHVAEACGLPVVVSSALETSAGLAAGVALAAALPELPYACGLATLSLLDGDVCADPLLPEDGALPVRRPEPSPALLERWAADPATEADWKRRVTDAASRGPATTPLAARPPSNGAPNLEER
ncbi:MAG: o-succinylbenzoate synthase [Streptosporangiales bacterium]|nr:o-succinylbenzoate synthase [Streptosporangiales bacterium]